MSRGVKICDVTSDTACKWSSKDGKAICPVCEVFGCTGRARRFRLVVEGFQPLPLFFLTHREVYVSNGTWLTNLWGGQRFGRGQEAKYQLDRQTLYLNPLGSPPNYFTIKVVPLQPGDQMAAKVNALLSFIARYGALGARTQNGFGQIALKNGATKIDIPEEIKPKPEHFFSLTFEIPQDRLGRYQEQTNVRFVGNTPPGFKNHRQAPFIPLAFDLRYKTSAKHHFTGKGRDLGLRPLFQEWKGTGVADKLFGETSGDKSKSRIHVSHLYRRETGGPFHLKVFGFLPPDEMVNSPSIDEIKSKIKNFIQDERIFPNSRIVDEY
jgi:CRISPR-associated protein Cmr1